MTRTMPAALAIEPDCADMTVPGAATSCSATITDLGAIACVDGMTDFAADCSADLAVPGALPDPIACP